MTDEQRAVIAEMAADYKSQAVELSANAASSASAYLAIGIWRQLVQVLDAEAQLKYLTSNSVSEPTP